MIFVFGDCELDLDRFELRRAGRLRPVEPQVFDLLAVLIRERHRVVSKEELLDTVWGNRFVSESALTSRVKAARQAIGDDGRSQMAPPVSRRLHRCRRSDSLRPVMAPGLPTRPAVQARRW